MAHSVNRSTYLLPSTRLLKITIISLAALLLTVYSLSNRNVRAYSFGPPPGHTGAPGETLTCILCHSSFEQDSGPGILSIAGPKFYVPGEQYTFTITLTQSDRQRYGFQLTALDEMGLAAGTLVLVDPENTQLVMDEERGRTYVEHTEAGTYPVEPDQRSWTFNWVAPDVDVGEVGFYVAGNAADGDGTPEGDYIYTGAAGVVAASPQR